MNFFSLENKSISNIVSGSR